MPFDRNPHFIEDGLSIPPWLRRQVEFEDEGKSARDFLSSGD
jgi:hypothetical protein